MSDSLLSFDLGRIWCLAEMNNVTNGDSGVAFCHKSAGEEGGVPYQLIGFGKDCQQNSGYKIIGYLDPRSASEFINKYSSMLGNYKFNIVEPVGKCEVKKDMDPKVEVGIGCLVAGGLMIAANWALAAMEGLTIAALSTAGLGVMALGGIIIFVWALKD